ncbi:MAG: hypothetical protein U0528_07095 [Anaerolineae bacterium]
MQNWNGKWVLELEDGRLLTWAHYGMNLWSSTGAQIAELIEHKDWVVGVIELTDKRWLSWSSDATLKLWKHDGTLVKTLVGHSAHINGAYELKMVEYLGLKMQTYVYGAITAIL